MTNLKDGVRLLPPDMEACLLRGTLGEKDQRERKKARVSKRKRKVYSLPRVQKDVLMMNKMPNNFY